MKIDIQSIHFDADQKLLEFIDKKIEKLETFYDGIIGAEVFLRLQKDQEKHNKAVEIKLKVNESVLFSSEIDRSFESATDKAVDAMRSQITRYKSKKLK